MADAHGHDDHGKNIFKIYMAVAIALAVCTAASFVFNYLAHPDVHGRRLISVFVAFVGILIVALIKAALVGTYFMHLKWDWKLLYFLIIPAFILGTMMMIVFLPDIYFGEKYHNQEEVEISRMFERSLKGEK